MTDIGRGEYGDHDDALGQAAYEGYCKVVAQVSPMHGPWDHMAPYLKEAWIAAGRAAAARDDALGVSYEQDDSDAGAVASDG